MTCERVHPSGAYRLTTTVRGHLFTRLYMGYTKREATALFRSEIRSAS